MNQLFGALMQSLYSEKKNPKFDPTKELGPDNQPYIQPGFGTKLWNSDGANRAISANEHAMLAPGERATALGNNEALHQQGLEQFEHTATMEWNNSPELQGRYQHPELYVAAKSAGFGAPTQANAQLTATGDYTKGVPGMQSNNNFGAAQNTSLQQANEGRKLMYDATKAPWESETDANILSNQTRIAQQPNIDLGIGLEHNRLTNIAPVDQEAALLDARNKVRSLTAEGNLNVPELSANEKATSATYGAAANKGLLEQLPAVQRYNAIKNRYDTANTKGLLQSLPAVQRLRDLTTGNDIFAARHNVPAHQQLDLTQVKHDQGMADEAVNQLPTERSIYGTNMRNNDFIAQHDPRINSLLNEPTIAGFTGDGYTATPSPVYESPEMRKWKESQAVMAQMQGGKFTPLANAIGAQKLQQSKVVPFGNGKPITTRPVVGNTAIPPVGDQGSSSVPMEASPTATQAAMMVEKPSVLETGVLPPAGRAIAGTAKAVAKPFGASGEMLYDRYSNDANYKSPVGQDINDLLTLAKTFMMGSGGLKQPIMQEDLDKAAKARSAAKNKKKERPAIGKYNWQTGKFDPAQ